jgi:hypothetical protein
MSTEWTQTGACRAIVLALTIRSGFVVNIRTSRTEVRGDALGLADLKTDSPNSHFRHRAFRERRVAVRGPDLAAFEPEAAIGNPRLDELTSGGHCCGTKNVTTITDYRLQVSAQNGGPGGHEDRSKDSPSLDGCRRERHRRCVFEPVLRVKSAVTGG